LISRGLHDFQGHTEVTREDLDSIKSKDFKREPTGLPRRDSWVAEIRAFGGCYALMDTREAALAELQKVFALIAQEQAQRSGRDRLRP
jgi:predicted RNase H-like HicB family nuclease